MHFVLTFLKLLNIFQVVFIYHYIRLRWIFFYLFFLLNLLFLDELLHFVFIFENPLIHLILLLFDQIDHPLILFFTGLYEHDQMFLLDFFINFIMLLQNHFFEISVLNLQIGQLALNILIKYLDLINNIIPDLIDLMILFHDHLAVEFVHPSVHHRLSFIDDHLVKHLYILSFFSQYFDYFIFEFLLELIMILRFFDSFINQIFEHRFVFHSVKCHHLVYEYIFMFFLFIVASPALKRMPALTFETVQIDLVCGMYTTFINLHLSTSITIL